jgi:hypothetical protein
MIYTCLWIDRFRFVTIDKYLRYMLEQFCRYQVLSAHIGESGVSVAGLTWNIPNRRNQEAGADYDEQIRF